MRRVRPALVLALVAALLALPTAAFARHRPDFEIDQEALDAKLAELERDGVTTSSGQLAGAAWIAQVPDDWNGELVVWAHGFRGEGPDLTVSEPAAHEWLLDNGYAWTASSYRRNSYDPGVGVLDSLLLTYRIQAEIGRAEKTYLAGVSMGGHVTAAAIERFPRTWDGALPTCGVLGDVELFDYFLDYNLGAAAFAGLEADELEYPDANWVGDEVVEIKEELSDEPEYFLDESDPDEPVTRNRWAAGGSFLAGGVTNLTSEGQQFKDFIEVGSGGERGTIFDVGWDYWHLLAQPTGDFFFALGEGDGTIANRRGIAAQNSDTDYSSEYGFDIDDEVVRVTGSRRIRNSRGLKPAPLIQGTPPVPTLTMHTIGDLFVPIENEQIYAQEVAANGLSDRLVQRAIRDVGHCTFTDAEWIQSYTDLFDWVETGNRPAGDDLVADIGDPLLGCEWTINEGAPDGAVRAFPCP